MLTLHTSQIRRNTWTLTSHFYVKMKRFLSNGTLYSCFIVSWCWPKMRQCRHTDTVDIIECCGICDNLLSLVDVGGWCCLPTLDWQWPVPVHGEQTLPSTLRRSSGSSVENARIWCHWLGSFFTYCTVRLYTVTSTVLHVLHSTIPIFFLFNEEHRPNTVGLHCIVLWCRKICNN